MATSTGPRAPTEEIALLEAELVALHERLSEARRRAPIETVPNSPLLDREGKLMRISDCFGDRDELLVVHNMGQRCSYCSLWADGFIGFWPHLERRCAFVLVSEDPPEVLDRFARSRGWPFPVASMAGSDLARVLGFETSPGHTYPGVSALQRRPDGSIARTGRGTFGPGDDYCAIWHLFDLFERGPNGWEPK